MEQQHITCVGRGSGCFKAEHLGLTVLDFSLQHLGYAAGLMVAVFLCHAACVRYVLHPLKSMAARVGVVAALCGLHCGVVNFAVPWFPFFIREISIVIAITGVWKAIELATQRVGEAMGSFFSYLTGDALVMRPEILIEPSIVAAKAEARNKPIADRIRSVAPVMLRSLAQSLAVEVRRSHAAPYVHMSCPRLWACRAGETPCMLFA